MKYIFIFIILSLFFSKNLYSEVKISNFKDYKETSKNFNLKEIYKGLNQPWGMTFIDDKNLLITEKKGTLFRFNVESKKISKIKHNLKVKWANQGGLLDVLYHD